MIYFTQVDTRLKPIQNFEVVAAILSVPVVSCLNDYVRPKSLEGGYKNIQGFVKVLKIYLSEHRKSRANNLAYLKKKK